MNRENEWIPAPDPAHRCDQSNGKKREQKQKQDKSRTVISVREMGDLLGLKKTERYWLVHKNYFETKTAIGKMWVDIASFENWYANQLKYKKVTGEEPGQKIREWTYSAKDISQMLGIVEAGAYDLIKRESIETVIIDDRIRVPKKAFHEWYAGQSHYRTQEDRQADAKIEESTLSLPQVAALLGVPRNTVYSILRDQRYQHFFEIIVVAGRKRVTKESFAAFLKGQDHYRLRTDSDDRSHDVRSSGNRSAGDRSSGDKSSGKGNQMVVSDEEGSDESISCGNRENTFLSALLSDMENLQPAQATGSGENSFGENCSEERQDEYISLAEAASRAFMSRQAISRYAEKGCFKFCRVGRKVRISRNGFERWLATRQEELMKY